MDPVPNPRIILLAGVKLRKAFGGRLGFFGIGGAKLDIFTQNLWKNLQNSAD